MCDAGGYQFFVRNKGLRDIGFLQNHKFTRPDILSPSFLKDGSEVLAFELIRLVGSSLDKAHFPNR